MDRTGQQLGSYRLVRLLGRGSFGEVYLGEHLHLKTEVAIKVLIGYLNVAGLRRFLAETRTIARLRHRHIVRLLDFGVEADIPYIVMDYAPNGSLRQHYANGTRVPLSEVVMFVKQIAEALDYIHGERIIHRDVKPENMLLGRDNDVLLSDFSIPHIFESITSETSSDATMGGTPAYMAPEQFRSKAVPASDQYSLGVVVYEWLSGERPFSGTVMQLLYQHLNDAPPLLRNKVPLISPLVEQVILTALDKRPEKRFATVGAFATALEQAAFSQEATISESWSPRLNTTPEFPPYPQAQGLSSYPSAGAGQGIGQIPATISSPSSTAVTKGSQIVAHAPKALPHRKIPRRAIVVSLAGLLGIAVVEGAVSRGITWDALFSHGNPQPTPGTIGSRIITYRGHSNTVTEVAWSPDSKRIASGSLDGTVQIWDATTGSRIFTYRPPAPASGVTALSWSSDDKLIAIGNQIGMVFAWSVPEQKLVFSYSGPASITTVAWSPDGRFIASGSSDGLVQVRDAAVGRNISELSSAGVVTAIAWSPDSLHIASASLNSTAQEWLPTTGNTIRSLGGPGITAIAWSPDGKFIATGDENSAVLILNASDGNAVYEYKNHTAAITSVAWSPLGKRIASASLDKTVQLWDALDGKNLYVYRGHTEGVTAVAWSPNNKYIASASRDKTVQVWVAS